MNENEIKTIETTEQSSATPDGTKSTENKHAKFDRILKILALLSVILMSLCIIVKVSTGDTPLEYLEGLYDKYYLGIDDDYYDDYMDNNYYDDTNTDTVRYANSKRSSEYPFEGLYYCEFNDTYLRIILGYDENNEQYYFVDILILNEEHPEESEFVYSFEIIAQPDRISKEFIIEENHYSFDELRYTPFEFKHSTFIDTLYPDDGYEFNTIILKYIINEYETGLSYLEYKRVFSY